MQNEQRLIDANALTEYFERLARSLANARCFSAADAVRGAAEKVASAPTIDAVKVVRCRKCYYRDKPSCCPYQYSGFKVEPDWYCPMGVKMDAKDMDVPTKDGGAE